MELITKKTDYWAIRKEGENNMCFEVNGERVEFPVE